MRHRGWVRAVTAVVVLAPVATASAYAASASSARAARGSRVLDRTYTCRVRPQHCIDVNTNVTVPPDSSGRGEPAQVWLDTVHKTEPLGGLQVVVPQVRFESVKNTLSVDRSLCRRSSRRIALRPAGLPLYETVTLQNLGEIDARCVAAKRVAVRFRIRMTDGKPEHSLVAIHNDALKRGPVEFLKWSPSKITAYMGNSCTDTS